jgi:hypothetical protein
MSAALQENTDTPEQSIRSSCENSSTGNDRRKVHVVIQGKGGIGKTVAAINLIQYLRDSRKQPVAAVDLDPMNHTLAEYLGLHAASVALFDDTEHVSLAGGAIDTMMQAALTDDTSTVIDNGAAGFVRYCSYLAETDIAGLLAERDRELVVHAVIAGGDMFAQCLFGLNTILTTLPDTVHVVVWLNEHSGPVEYDGKRFEDMSVYLDNRGRIVGLVRMPRLSPLFLADFNTMSKQRLTYAEAIDSPAFHIMNRKRLDIIRRAVWQQLDQVL